MRPDQTLNWMHDGTERLLAEVAGLPDDALSAPTALPGWTRAYLLSHLAANADALRNLVHWARTGEERRMYASTQTREADIAAGAEHPPAHLRARVASSAADLAADLDALTPLTPAAGRPGTRRSSPPRALPGRPTRSRGCEPARSTSTPSTWPPELPSPTCPPTSWPRCSTT